MGGFSLESEFYCCRCGNKGIKIPRRSGAARKAGHLKKLFCIYCGTEWNHVECKENTKYDYADFRIEFDYGNFDKDGNRIIPYGEFKASLHNGGML